MEAPTTMQFVNLAGLILGLGATYGKITSALKEFKAWQEKHEKENSNALNRMDEKIQKLDARIDLRSATVEQKLLRDDGSSRYMKIEDCTRLRAEQEKHQKMYYETVKAIIIEYHEKSHKERMEMANSISTMNEKVAVLVTRLDMTK